MLLRRCIALIKYCKYCRKREQHGIIDAENPDAGRSVSEITHPSDWKERARLAHRRCGIIAVGRLSLHAAVRALARCRASARQRGTVWTGSRASLRQQRGISEGEKKGNQKIPGTARTARPGAGTGGSGTLCSVHGGVGDLQYCVRQESDQGYVIPSIF